MASHGFWPGRRDEHGRCQLADDDFIALQVKSSQLHIARDAYESGFTMNVHIVEENGRGVNTRTHARRFRYAGWLVHFRVASRHFWLRCGRSRIEASRDEIIDGQWATWTGVGIDDIGYLDAAAVARCPACVPVGLDEAIAGAPAFSAAALDESFSSLHV